MGCSQLSKPNKSLQCTCSPPLWQGFACWCEVALSVVTDQPANCSMQDPTGEAAAEAQKHLTLYELDLGLNHVMRKWSQPIDNGANLLIPVPGGGDGPGGVIVCAENFLIYKNQVWHSVASY